MAKLQLRSARGTLTGANGSTAGLWLAGDGFVILSPSRSPWLRGEHSRVPWSRWRIDATPGSASMSRSERKRFLVQNALCDVGFRTRHEAALALAVALDLDGYEVKR